MSKQLQLQVILEAVDKVSAPLQRMNKRISKSAEQLQKMKSGLKKLNTSQNDIDLLSKYEAHAKSAFSKKGEMMERQLKLSSQLQNAAKPSKKMRQELARLEKRIAKTNEQFLFNSERVKTTSERLREAGVDTRYLATEKQRLTGQIEKQTAAVEKQKAALGKLHQRHRRREKVKNIVDKGRRLAVRGALVGGASAYGLGRFASGFISTAAEFERYEAVLKTTEGSSEKAKKAMQWVSEFATKTPYDVAQVTDSFVKLRAYGLDPTSGLLQTLGDTSAAMGKPLMQAVEAIADAVTGENERLKEFGIKASTKGDTVTYNYTDKNGEQKFLKVNKNNRKAIEKTLTNIWNEKFTGAMITQSTTWIGMMSNLRDHWRNFQRAVMESGALDNLKNKVNSVLTQLNTMVANGKLQQFAKRVSQWFIHTADGIWQFGKSIKNAIQWVQDFVAPIGGLGNAIKLFLGALAVGKLTAFTSGLSVLAGLLVANPIIASLAAITAALSYAAYEIYQNWESIATFFSQQWQRVTSAFSRGWQQLKNDTWGTLGQITRAIVDWSPLNTFHQAFAGVMSYFGVEVPDKLSEYFANIGASVKDAILNWNPTQWFSDIFSGAFTWVENKLEGMVQFFTDIKNKISNFFGESDAKMQALSEKQKKANDKLHGQKQRAIYDGIQQTVDKTRANRIANNLTPAQRQALEDLTPAQLQRLKPHQRDYLQQLKNTAKTPKITTAKKTLNQSFKQNVTVNQTINTTTAGVPKQVGAAAAAAVTGGAKQGGSALLMDTQ